MAKLIKGLVVLAVLVAGIVLAVRYAGGSKSDAAAAGKPKSTQDEQKKDGVQVQEKYGFAPAGDGG